MIINKKKNFKQGKYFSILSYLFSLSALFLIYAALWVLAVANICQASVWFYNNHSGGLQWFLQESLQSMMMFLKPTELPSFLF